MKINLKPQIMNVKKAKKLQQHLSLSLPFPPPRPKKNKRKSRKTKWTYPIISPEPHTHKDTHIHTSTCDPIKKTLAMQDQHCVILPEWSIQLNQSI
jgi:hypothetical protein